MFSLFFELTISKTLRSRYISNKIRMNPISSEGECFGYTFYIESRKSHVQDEIGETKLFNELEKIFSFEGIEQGKEFIKDVDSFESYLIDSSIYHLHYVISNQLLKFYAIHTIVDPSDLKFKHSLFFGKIDIGYKKITSDDILKEKLLKCVSDSFKRIDKSLTSIDSILNSKNLKFEKK